MIRCAVKILLLLYLQAKRFVWYGMVSYGVARCCVVMRDNCSISLITKQFLHWVMQSFIIANVHQSRLVTLIRVAKSSAGFFPFALSAPNVSIFYPIYLPTFFILCASSCPRLKPEARWYWGRGCIVYGYTACVTHMMLGLNKRGYGGTSLFVKERRILKFVFHIV